MRNPVVALLTDFGTRDHYAGTLKAVVLSVCPDATLVDIGHDIDPHDVLGGALELAACYRYFPAGTVFLVVVDPGVGSSRRGLVAETRDYRFVAPDNGVLTGVFSDTPPSRVVELTERKYARAAVSRTFEGRDRFAPAAGWLAKGTTVAAFGRAIADYHRLVIPRASLGDDSIAGSILRVDRFGNLISNIDRAAFDHLARGGPIVVRINDRTVDRVVATYAEATPGELCALFGSTEHLEVAVNGGSAAALLGAGRGASVTVGATDGGH
ncbi:MAG TPA: SAM-dependent chlorinase/fluorinase [Vicinamibacterales bacterium]|nr:SAM-dependent chlorinase/fluorinase [Vicinamibacterales bacterium]